ncbi:hypothetical protein AXF42_Ash000025 [Apostasia shenzhenica]|uniref:Uncharacterized protein n=1 Tax=Apostasia shenzhenica TaxID=1088818 RepID=A0A2I0AF61_9ASPA|nr:hypothetical protein AXF42_Ash000025 [Apostasia shenzhenica]
MAELALKYMKCGEGMRTREKEHRKLRAIATVSSSTQNDPKQKEEEEQFWKMTMIEEEKGLLQQWVTKNLTTTFFRCTRWRVEETADLLNCPFHYFCDTSYAGNHYPFVDLFVLIFLLCSFLSASAFTALEFGSRGQSFWRRRFKRRYLLPSGPILLPLVVLILYHGQRINSLFPLSQMGPALLLLVHISALSFESRGEQRSLRYAVLEASTVSGILHASMYLDSIILPYYTGLDALERSVFSGECPTCVCRREDMVAGGRIVLYRGWSKSTLAIVAALCSRMLGRIFGEEKSTLLVKLTAEVIGWGSVAGDAVYLLRIDIPGERESLMMAIYGGICALISCNELRKVYGAAVWLAAKRHSEKKKKYVSFEADEIL